MPTAYFSGEILNICSYTNFLLKCHLVVQYFKAYPNPWIEFNLKNIESCFFVYRVKQL